MTNRGLILSRKRFRGACSWVCAGVMLLILPAGAGAQCPVPEHRLNEYWQLAYEAYEGDDCVSFVEYAGWYYGMVNHSNFSWDTLEIHRALTHCKGVLYSLHHENANLRRQLSDLRRQQSGGSSVSSITSGVTAAKPSLRFRPPHDLP